MLYAKNSNKRASLTEAQGSRLAASRVRDWELQCIAKNGGFIEIISRVCSSHNDRKALVPARAGAQEPRDELKIRIEETVELVCESKIKRSDPNFFFRVRRPLHVALSSTGTVERTFSISENVSRVGRTHIRID